MTLSKADLSSNRLFCGIILVVLCLIYASVYLPYVIPPQFGWWHYYAWRMQEGDVLYKDIYLFLPPYFVFLTRLLFSFFDNHFILYTYLVGVPVKLLCVLLMYNVMCKVTKPVYASIAVFTSLCLSTCYPMDVWYDFNPIIMLPCLCVAWLFMSFFSHIKESNKCSKYRMFLIGLLLSVILCMKHPFGLALMFAIIVGLFIIYAKEYDGSRKEFAWAVVFMIIGGVIGVAPCIYYLTVHDCWNDFINCMWSIKAAKGGSTKILMRLPIAFGAYTAWLGVAATFALVYIAKRYANKKCISSFLCTSTQRSIITLILFVFIGVYIYAYSKLPSELHQGLFEDMHLISVNFVIIYYLTYGSIAIWGYFFFRYITRKEQATPILVFGTLMMAHFLMSVVSADNIENLYMLFYCPWILVFFFNSHSVGRIIENGLIIVFCLIIVSIAVTTKIAHPYSWHGWTTSPITDDEIYSTVPGLEGQIISKNVNSSYQRIVSLINENCKEPDDKVYEFSNIMLFNVLTKKETPGYTPISWIDVCPDANAVSTAKEIQRNPPKVIIWDSMDTKNWTRVEDVYRGGNPSGQRLIQKGFLNMVKSNRYRCVLSIPNNRDGNIQLYVRNPDLKIQLLSQPVGFMIK